MDHLPTKPWLTTEVKHTWGFDIITGWLKYTLLGISGVQRVNHQGVIYDFRGIFTPGPLVQMFYI